MRKDNFVIFNFVSKNIKNSNPLKFKKFIIYLMSPIFKCLICRKDIERSTKTFWIKKGHLLCSTCLDNIDKDKDKDKDKKKPR